MQLKFGTNFAFCYFVPIKYIMEINSFWKIIDNNYAY